MVGRRVHVSVGYAFPYRMHDFGEFRGSGFDPLSEDRADVVKGERPGHLSTISRAERRTCGGNGW